MTEPLAPVEEVIAVTEARITNLESREEGCAHADMLTLLAQERTILDALRALQEPKSKLYWLVEKFENGNGNSLGAIGFSGHSISPNVYPLNFGGPLKFADEKSAKEFCTVLTIASQGTSDYRTMFGCKATEHMDIYTDPLAALSAPLGDEPVVGYDDKAKRLVDKLLSARASEESPANADLMMEAAGWIHAKSSPFAASRPPKEVPDSRPSEGGKEGQSSHLATTLGESKVVRAESSACDGEWRVGSLAEQTETTLACLEGAAGMLRGWVGGQEIITDLLAASLLISELLTRLQNANLELDIKRGFECKQITITPIGDA